MIKLWKKINLLPIWLRWGIKFSLVYFIPAMAVMLLSLTYCLDSMGEACNLIMGGCEMPEICFLAYLFLMFISMPILLGTDFFLYRVFDKISMIEGPSGGLLYIGFMILVSLIGYFLFAAIIGFIFGKIRRKNFDSSKV